MEGSSQFEAYLSISQDTTLIFSYLLQPATLSISNGGVETLKLVDESNEATSNVNIYDRQNSAVEQKRNTRLNSNKSLLDDDSDDEVRQDDRRD